MNKNWYPAGNGNSHKLHEMNSDVDFAQHVLGNVSLSSSGPRANGRTDEILNTGNGNKELPEGNHQQYDPLDALGVATEGSREKVGIMEKHMTFMRHLANAKASLMEIGADSDVKLLEEIMERMGTA